MTRTTRKIAKYRPVLYRCDRCGDVRRTSTALDFVRCRSGQDDAQVMPCDGHYVRVER